jgi:hypothetical protein
MPTNRTRTRRAPLAEELQPTPEELQWLTGVPQEGANRFWVHTWGRDKAARCRRLVAEHADLIPPRRLPALLADLARWDRPLREANDD